MNALPGQLELATVIKHKPFREIMRDNAERKGREFNAECIAYMHEQEDTHKPAGVRLAKMLCQYDDSPSSQLWSDIQRLAREILK